MSLEGALVPQQGPGSWSMLSSQIFDDGHLPHWLGRGSRVQVLVPGFRQAQQILLWGE